MLSDTGIAQETRQGLVATLEQVAEAAEHRDHAAMARSALCTFASSPVPFVSEATPPACVNKDEYKECGQFSARVFHGEGQPSYVSTEVYSPAEPVRRFSGDEWKVAAEVDSYLEPRRRLAQECESEKRALAERLDEEIKESALRKAAHQAGKCTAK